MGSGNVAAFDQVSRDRGANEFDVFRVDSDTTHRATALPAGWAGRRVRINVLTATTTVDVAFSTSSSAEVDTSVAPANNAVTTKCGMRLAAATPERLRLPNWEANQTGYIVHEASAANTIFEVALIG